MTTEAEKEFRNGYRIHRIETIFLETRPLSSDRCIPATIVMCNSSDLSVKGLQVLHHEEIPLGSILRICVDMKHQDPVYLVGEVKWVQPNENEEGFSIGFGLLDAAGADMLVWESIISDLLANMTLEIPSGNAGRSERT